MNRREALQWAISNDDTVSNDRGENADTVYELIEALKALGITGEELGQLCGVWEVLFFTPNLKWKYTDYVYIQKPSQWQEPAEAIAQAIASDNGLHRRTSIRDSTYYVAILPHNPWGFPLSSGSHQAI